MFRGIISARMGNNNRDCAGLALIFKPIAGEYTVNVQQFAEIEALKALKARYFRTLDTKQWDAWGECFTADLEASFDGADGSFDFGSRDELVSTNRELLADVVTVHQGHSPELELTGATTARGIWAMYDRVELPGAEFEGWGHYHEEYVKQGGDWKIARIHLTRLKISPLLPS
jgi:hypothetical protein